MIKHNSDFKREFGNVLYHEPGGLMYHPKDTNNYFFPRIYERRTGCRTDGAFRSRK